MWCGSLRPGSVLPGQGAPKIWNSRRPRPADTHSEIFSWSADLGRQILDGNPTAGQIGDVTENAGAVARASDKIQHSTSIHAGTPPGEEIVLQKNILSGRFGAGRRVLSDKCEPVSEWPVTVRVMPYRVGAT